MAGENTQNLKAAYNLTASSVFIQVLIYLFFKKGGDLHTEVMFEIFHSFASKWDLLSRWWQPADYCDRLALPV